MMTKEESFCLSTHLTGSENPYPKENLHIVSSGIPVLPGGNKKPHAGMTWGPLRIMP
jgi:hypothetical protein